jgi:hypothetical protein
METGCISCSRSYVVRPVKKKGIRLYADTVATLEEDSVVLVQQAQQGPLLQLEYDGATRNHEDALNSIFPLH